jgi:type IX secretion system PorP/SprF family membrane protein
MMKKSTFIFSFLMLVVGFSMAQDAVFSQYFASGIYFNPSMAATETSVTLSGISRTQWKGVGTPYQTSMLAITLPIKDKFEKHKRLGGVTFSLYSDKSGDKTLRTIGLNTTLAYGFNISDKNLIFFGATAGYYQKTLNQANFQWGSQYNPLIGWDSSVNPNVGTILDNTNYFDINAGILAVHDLEKNVGTDRAEIFLGLATYHINSPNESLVEGNTSELPLRINANLGALLPLKEHIGISPNVLYVQQGSNRQLNLGVYGTYYFLNVDSKGITPNNIELGTWYRLQDAFIFNIGIGNEVYHLGFSYDMTTSNLKYSSSGNSAYEISFKIQKPHKKTERHYTPRF